MTHTITGDKETPDMRASKLPLGKAQPQLAVTNVDEAIRYYKDILGFFVEFAMQDESGMTYLANLWRGDLCVFLRCSEDIGPSSTFSWLGEAADLDALYDDFVEAGATIKEAPAHRPWGLYEMTIIDPYSNEFRFATSSPKRDGEDKYKDLRR